MRPWLVVTLVVLGVAAAGLIGYAVGGSSRDDEVQSAEAQEAKAQKALEEEQAQDEEALEAVTTGLQELGSAIEQQDAQDDQAAQAAVDQAAQDIQGGLDRLGAEARNDAEQAASDLSERVNEAVGSGTEGNVPEGGG